MDTNKDVVVALSGGVDSAVTAALLKDRGYKISSVTFTTAFSAPGMVKSAIALAGFLGVPHKLVDISEVFQQYIIDPFLHEYEQGRTPNPCVICNRKIKFGVLLRFSLAMECSLIATGHYVRILKTGETFSLYKGIDQFKDQAYFLYRLGQKELSRMLCPLGEYRREEVIKMAQHYGLMEYILYGNSQDICFIPDNDCRAFLRSNVAMKPGNIVNRQGAVLGTHTGFAGYTIGQRKGLGIAGLQRLYVTELDAHNNTVVLGSREDLECRAIAAEELSWVSGTAPGDCFVANARIRHRMPESKATTIIDGETARVSFDEPVWAVAPGQSVVFYRGEEVLGGGIISRRLDNE